MTGFRAASACSEAESVYLESIARDPKAAAQWNGLGDLYCDHFDRPADAEEAFDHALRRNSGS